MPVPGPMYAPAARRKSLAGIAARARAALHRRLAANGREGSIATGRGKLQVQPCPQCPVSDGRPEKGGLR
jgi:hypothetical protein